MAKPKINEARVAYTDALAAYLHEPERRRYLTLVQKASLTPPEQEERIKLQSKAHQWRYIQDAWEWCGLNAAKGLLIHRQGSPAEARNFLRAVISPCYPSFMSTSLKLSADGAYDLQSSYTKARQALESVLYVMNYTDPAMTLADGERRKLFFDDLNGMLQPFQKLKSGEKLDLHDVFEFKAKGRGKRTRDMKDGTLTAWEEPCLDVHLLSIAGVKHTPAIARVAEVHGKESGALTHAYRTWSTHPVRKVSLRVGDSYAREVMTMLDLHELLEMAYPRPPAPIKSHRYPSS